MDQQDSKVLASLAAELEAELEKDEARRREDARARLTEALQKGLVEIGDMTWKRDDLYSRGKSPQTGD
jgi:hypothetical protein